ncbi:MAG: carbamoyl-phosphate synthase large subunit [Nitrospinae bacterium]|nr:carbamoyl-phosphate synthase large subunit [Nitrospinota bacterium]
MPRRENIKKIMIIGAGPIVIGQACEFDYSGSQACKVLKEEGYEVVLINSNPATIMTDIDMADAVYIEPITKDFVSEIVRKERPDAILPTMGGQTGLNTAVDVAESGLLDELGIELIGADLNSIKKAEDRDLFQAAMKKIGLSTPQSCLVHTLEEAMACIEEIKLPAILRPSFTMGGTGGGVARTLGEYQDLILRGLDASPVNEVLVEKSIIGWKEFELEVMRDKNDNVVIICSIENFDPMGVHTGDSITIAPAQTLTDKEYQLMRDAALKIIREIGVETGGSNVQFALNPENGELIVVEMNPRVSRSSALASKATGFPIAKIAAKLAVGYTLDEIKNDITKVTPASFEPSIDYCVVKVPRFTFEKFPETNSELTTQMKSVGEAMSIGRTFKEALQKSLRSLETSKCGFDEISNVSEEIITEMLTVPNAERLWYIGEAYRQGFSTEKIFELTKIDPWFLTNIEEIIEIEKEIQENVDEIFNNKDLLTQTKGFGMSDKRLAQLTNNNEINIYKKRMEMGVAPVFKRVDTCAAEFIAHTPYLYSTYRGDECETRPTDKKKMMILGGGPNRIGQGIEFDYCCVHAVLALKELGFETIMVNCNPETVSTDYDTSDRLYFEPLTFEDVMAIIHIEKPDGVIVQFGGQTPLKVSQQLKQFDFVKIAGTSPEAIDRAEDRNLFKKLLNKLNLKQPENAIAYNRSEVLTLAEEVGFPVVVRPSYVLGGRAMEIVYDKESLLEYLNKNEKYNIYEHSVLIDKFLENAVEIDVDGICDGEDVIVPGIMEHIEEAGIHSGDSACSLPPYSLSKEIIKEIEEQTRKIAFELEVIGLLNIQFAVKNNEIFIIEVNPRASRTVPFVSKATGVQWAKVAAKVIAGKKLKELVPEVQTVPKHYSVKEAVFPFIKFSGVDTILGPEMKSTGEVMGIDATFESAFMKAQHAAGTILPTHGNVFISVHDYDKEPLIPISKELKIMGFTITATAGTHNYLKERGIESTLVNKVFEGDNTIIDWLINGKINMVINTTIGKKSKEDSFSIRRNALLRNVPYFTTISAAKAATKGIDSLINKKYAVNPLHSYYI